MIIKALQILPPLAFARFGSASEPQANYELEENPSSLGFRRVIPADTLIVAEDGTLTTRRAADPSELKLADLNEIFRNGDRIRPVAPFFELWAITDEDENQPMPLTRERLVKAGLDLSAINWNVRVENRKVFRRTGDKDDIVWADTGSISDHVRKPLSGECPHFTAGKTINFGFVQFIKPNMSDIIRLRFTPGPGKIYGPDWLGEFHDTNTHESPGYTSASALSTLGVPLRPSKHRPSGFMPDADAQIYRGGTWTRFDATMPGENKTRDGAETWPRKTLPTSLYANTDAMPPWLNHDRAKSSGYLDDACDGFIHVTMKLSNDKTLDAKARICSAPPDFVPDSRFVRTLADDLDQVVNGPSAEGIGVAEARRRALDIVRRAYETVRFMNVAVMNGNDVDGRPADTFDTMPAEVAFATERSVSPVMSPASVDTAAIVELHQQVFAALSAGTAPWFSRLLRRPDEMGLLTDRGRRKMPALMSGADSFYLALTHRQIATVEMATEGAVQRALSPRNLTAERLTAQINHKAAGNPVNSRPEMAVANCCPGLEVDFRAVWRRLFEGIELGEHDNYVVAGTARNADGKIVDLKGRRMLTVAGKPVIAPLRGPSPSVPDGDVPVFSGENPHGFWTMEWSNCFAHVIALRASGTTEVACEFTAEPAKDPVSLKTNSMTVTLKIADFFEPGTAVISKKLAAAGELTQGLCSPWQNDLRECSCYYWASSRPDFVNTSIGGDGLTHGDNWFAKSRTGEYVPDDYADSRLIGYEDLFTNWEQLQFQIGGKDSAPDLPGAVPRSRKP